MAGYRTIVSSKGQVIIPAELREKLGLEKGTPATWTHEEGKLVLTPMTKQRLREIRGFLRPVPGAPTMFDELFDERDLERKREKR